MQATKKFVNVDRFEVETVLNRAYHMVVEPNGCRPVQYSSICLQGPWKEYSPTRGLGSGLVSLVPYLGDALGMVGIIKKVEIVVPNL